MKVPKFATYEPKRLPYDPSDRDGATILARRIERVWAECGHFDVVCSVEPDGFNDRGGAAYVVRSNLINGLPPE